VGGKEVGRMRKGGENSPLYIPNRGERSTPMHENEFKTLTTFLDASAG